MKWRNGDRGGVGESRTGEAECELKGEKNLILISGDKGREDRTGEMIKKEEVGRGTMWDKGHGKVKEGERAWVVCV